MNKRPKIEWCQDWWVEKGVLNKKQRQTLSIDHQISLEGIQDLSYALAWILEYELPYRAFSLKSYFDEHDQSIKPFREAMRQLDLAQLNLKKFDELMSPIVFEASNEWENSNLFESNTREQLTEAERLIRLLRARLKSSVVYKKLSPIIPGSKSSKPGAPKDERRALVVDACLQRWAEEGKKVGYSTDANDVVSGPMVRFIQAVVAEITVDRVSLNPSTIKSLVQAWKRDKNE